MPSPSQRRTSQRWPLVALALLLVLALAWWFRPPARPSERATPRTTTGLPTPIAAPRLRVDEYRRAAHDATREERLTIDRPALELAFADARTLNEAHFETPNARELDVQACTKLLSAPNESRGELFRARGRIASVVHIEATEGASAHWRGRLDLEGGGNAFFAVLDAPGAVSAGDFVRVDGVFLEIACETTPSGWLDAPLLVGARAVRSYPALGRVASIAELTPDDALWKLVAYARGADTSSIDWDAAPKLDDELLAELASNESRWRGKPVRIDAAQVQTLAIAKEDENPARAERLTRGWLGSWAWMKSSNGLAQFVSPQLEFDVRTGDEVVARGFFVANQRYESAGRGEQVAPLFVVQSFERRVDDPLSFANAVSSRIVLAALAMVAACLFVLHRDRRRSDEFELARLRRRERRAASSPTFS